MKKEKAVRSPQTDSDELLQFKRNGDIVKLDPIRLLQRQLSRSMSNRSSSNQQSVEDIKKETILLSRLAFKLLQLFGFGYQWIIMAIRLILFTLLLMPALLHQVYLYMNANGVKNVLYGPNKRNYLDIFLPDTQSDGKRPVMVFISGGAWIIGYKGWGALFGHLLSAYGVIVVTPDYRNFPQGTISDMLNDTETAVQWVFDHIESYGGDVEQVYLVGQSAGAHISCMSMLRRTVREREGLTDISWKGSDLRGWIGISGAYNLVVQQAILHKRGLYKRIFQEIMENDLVAFSPSKLLRSNEKYTHPDVVQNLPPIYLFHGGDDNCIPDSSSFELAFVLSKLQVDVTPVIYIGKSHTDPIIEDPMRGSMNLLSDLLMIIKGTREPMKSVPMLNKYAIAIAKFVNPF